MKRAQKKRTPTWAKKPEGERLKGRGWNRMERAERLQLIKKARRKEGIGYMGRSLISYSKLFGIDFKALIRRKVNALQRQRKKERTTILDLGEGKGIAMKNIKAVFGGKVFVCALDVARRISKRTVDEVRVGDFETFPNQHFGRKFDFIFSVFGPTYHSSRPLHAIEKAVGLLEKGGMFFFNVDKNSVPYEQDVIRIAERTGCTYRHAETGNYYSFELTKK